MLKYWLWLSTRKGLGNRGIYLVARHFPTPEAAYFASPEEYAQIRELRSIQPLLDKDLSGAERIIRQCGEKNISILTMQDAAYPKRLLTLDDAPVVLYYKGRLPNFSGPAVAVVGTRKSSVYGMSQAKRISYGLARSGCMVVSGGASGVDTEAINGALLGDGFVITVLASGLDILYPAQNKELFRCVMERGCLLSEYPPGMKPLRSNFPVRNRIMSGLSLGVLITEAPERSGALITADRALEQGRDVFVLPANVGVASCGGNLKLLREGAIPVGEAWDILQEYAPQYPHILKKSEQSLPKEEPRVVIEEKKVIDKPKTRAYIDLKDIINTLDPREQTIVRLLEGGPQHIDVIVEKAAVRAAEALASLTLLEVRGLIRRPSVRVYELAEK